MRVTNQDLVLIKMIYRNDDGRIALEGNVDRAPYKRLVEFGWLTEHSLNTSTVEYQISVLGKHVAALD